MSSASQTIVLISGENQGLGFEIAENLILSGDYNIIHGSRDISKANSAAETLRSLPNIKAPSHQSSWT
ncbi:uncharacterized protein BDV17DRAFT_292684 [Aspergillus undulatus]|uniref:uncharacterized protein n=1 Tax=Aspergillus undulatus TaxID=1810928 RepID=UPI003CCD1234